MEVDNLLFDPNGVGKPNGNLFGFPFTPETAKVVAIPVCWDVTVSYSSGTAKGPKAILAASPQLDFYDEKHGSAWHCGIAMLPIDEDQQTTSKKLRKQAERYIDWLEQNKPIQDAPKMQQRLEEINKACENMVAQVFLQSISLLQKGKIPAVLGGDHSTPLGLIKALGQQYKQIGILQIDAHMDLRQAYEDFTYSHASVMYNAIQEPHVAKLVQVGIRDFCETEAHLVKTNDAQISVFTDREIQNKFFKGSNWHQICAEIVIKLPPLVYISFDIDGLDPSLCPNTGTPVPGGLSFAQAVYLIQQVVDAGKIIVGFDLVEVAPSSDNEWDANVGARLFYQLAILAAKSHEI